MSTQKGNLSRTRKQKYQNSTKFKNNLHDTSKTIKQINDLDLKGVCQHCKSIIDWKIQYKKYKPLSQPKKCVRCLQRNVIRAYYIVCDDCGANHNLCCKCGQSNVEVERPMPQVEEVREQIEFEVDIKALRERERRKFYRLMKKGLSGEEALAQIDQKRTEDDQNKSDNDDDYESISDSDDEDEN